MGFWWYLTLLQSNIWTWLSFQIKATFFPAGMLGLHGNIRSITSAIKSVQGNVKSTVCQSPSLHWVACVTHKLTGIVPLSTLALSSISTLSFCHTCSFSLIRFLSYTHVYTHTHTHKHTHTNIQTHTHWYEKLRQTLTPSGKSLSRSLELWKALNISLLFTILCHFILQLHYILEGYFLLFTPLHSDDSYSY